MALICRPLRSSTSCIRSLLWLPSGPAEATEEDEEEGGGAAVAASPRPPIPSLLGPCREDDEVAGRDASESVVCRILTLCRCCMRLSKRDVTDDRSPGCRGYSGAHLCSDGGDIHESNPSLPSLPSLSPCPSSSPCLAADAEGEDSSALSSSSSSSSPASSSSSSSLSPSFLSSTSLSSAANTGDSPHPISLIRAMICCSAFTACPLRPNTASSRASSTGGKNDGDSGGSGSNPFNSSNPPGPPPHPAPPPHGVMSAASSCASNSVRFTRSTTAASSSPLRMCAS